MMRAFLLVLGAVLLGCSSSAPTGTQALSNSEASLCPTAYEWKQGYCLLKEVYIAGGTFTMGRGLCPAATPLEQDPGTPCPLTDLPQTVSVPPFYIEAAPSGINSFPCTREKCDVPVLMGIPSTTSRLIAKLWSGDSIPDLCQERGRRLIREDEWEFVVTLGGTRIYPWGDDPPSCDRLWIGYDSACALPEPIQDIGGPVRIEQVIRILDHPPSPEGIFDLVHYHPHLVAPRPELYHEGYSPIPYDFLVSFDDPYFEQPDHCPTYQKNCTVGPVKKDPSECGERCPTRKWGARGGRQQFWEARPLFSQKDNNYERSIDAYKGYVRSLIAREKTIIHCVRDAP